MSHKECNIEYWGNQRLIKEQRLAIKNKYWSYKEDISKEIKHKPNYKYPGMCKSNTQN